MYIKPPKARAKNKNITLAQLMADGYTVKEVKTNRKKKTITIKLKSPLKYMAHEATIIIQL